MKAQASGYYHSYIDTTNIDLLALARFPSQDAVANAAQAAADEVDSLVILLGIIPTALYNIDVIPTPIQLPHLDSWAPDHDDNNNNVSFDVNDDS